MNNAQGGYRIIDFNGIDLINEKTLNTTIYKSIEESYKSKALLLSNIVIDKVEYNAVFKEIKHIDNYYTFEAYDRIIKVYADKVESMPSLENITDITTLHYDNTNNAYVYSLNYNAKLILKNNQTLLIESKKDNQLIYINSTTIIDGQDNSIQNLYRLVLNQQAGPHDSVMLEGYVLGFDPNDKTSITFTNNDSNSNMILIKYDEKLDIYYIYVINADAEL